MAMVTDPVADMLARIRNGSLAEHEKVDIPSSKLKVRLAEILKEEGSSRTRLIEDKHQGVLRVYLKYGPGQERVISGLRRVSKPGRRLYVGADRIPSVLGGWAWRSCPPRGACSRTGSPARPRWAGRSSATSGSAARGVASGRGRDDVEDRQEADRDPQGCPGGHPGAAGGRGQGPEGSPRARVHELCSVKVADGSVVVGRGAEHRTARALHGLTRALVANMVHGVTEGFERKLEIQGIGYRVQMAGRNLTFASATRTRSCSRCPRA